jgi:hypothetical protein
MPELPDGETCKRYLNTISLHQSINGLSLAANDTGSECGGKSVGVRSEEHHA